VPAQGAEKPPARRVSRVAEDRDLPTEDAALVQRLPTLLVVPSDQLHARELAATDLLGEPVFVVTTDLASARLLREARLDVIDRRHDLRRHRGGGVRGHELRLREGPHARAAGEHRQLGREVVRPREPSLRVLLQAA
jgi:hypothetical protein